MGKQFQTYYCKEIILLLQNKYYTSKQVYFQGMLELLNIQNAQVKIELVL